VADHRGSIPLAQGDGFSPVEAFEITEHLAKSLGVPPLAARILMARGITTPQDAEKFLNPRIEDLSDPFLLPDMEKGVDRLIRAVTGGERICLHGDYDADGVSSTALMVRFLRHLGVHPLIRLPERKEGYGLNMESVKKLIGEGTKLLVCLDCGSTNNDEIAYALEHGIDTIVIDHHELGDSLPAACALINPKRAGSRFPTRELAAAGVTFFFLLALRRSMHGAGLLKGHINLKQELDIAAIGTMGDMVALIGDNRLIARFGLEMMRTKPRTWLRSFFGKKILSRDRIDEFAVNFMIVPRINAAGRVSHPDRALELLICEDQAEADAALAVLTEANKDRQKIEERTLGEITGILGPGDSFERNSIVLFNEAWHAGVIGIVAQKLTELYGRPSIIITRSDGLWKGSGRGGAGVDLYDAISSVSHLLIRFGGHKYACGVTLQGENLELFRDAFEARISGTLEKRERIVRFDTEADFDELTGEVGDFLDRLSPFGVGNPRPSLLLTPRSLAPLNRSRIKITDYSGHTWFGWLPRQTLLPQQENVRIIASPSIKGEGDHRFVELNIREFVTPEE
jgi:single-stranded-DNA-specific exonuclease